MSNFRLKPTKLVTARRKKDDPEPVIATVEEVTPAVGLTQEIVETEVVEPVPPKKKETVERVIRQPSPTADIATMAKDDMLQKMYAAQAKKYEMQLNDLEEDERRERRRRERAEEDKADRAKEGAGVMPLLMTMGGMDPNRVNEMLANLDADTLFKMSLLSQEDPKAMLIYSMMQKDSDKDDKKDSFQFKDFLDFYKVMMFGQQVQTQTAKGMTPKRKDFEIEDMIKLMLTMQKQSDPSQFYQLMMQMTKEFQDTLHQRDLQMMDMRMQEIQRQITHPKDYLQGIAGDMQSLQNLFGGGQRTPEEIQLDGKLKMRQLDMQERQMERAESREKLDSLMKTVETAIDQFGQHVGKPLGEIFAQQAGQRTAQLTTPQQNVSLVTGPQQVIPTGPQTSPSSHLAPQPVPQPAGPEPSLEGLQVPEQQAPPQQRTQEQLVPAPQQPPAPMHVQVPVQPPQSVQRNPARKGDPLQDFLDGKWGRQ